MTHDLDLTTTKATFTRALAVSKVTASPDKSLPILNAVNLNVTARGNYVAQSTNRYLASRTYLRPSETSSHTDTFTELGGLSLSLVTVGFLQKWATLVDKFAAVTLAYTVGDGLTVSAPGAPTLSGLAAVEGKYPDIGTLIRTDEQVDYAVHDRAGATALSALNVGKLGAISHHCARHDAVLLRPGTKEGTNDLLFRISDGDVVMVDGIIMGVRSNDADPLSQHGL